MGQLKVFTKGEVAKFEPPVIDGAWSIWKYNRQQIFVLSDSAFNRILCHGREHVTSVTCNVSHTDNLYISFVNIDQQGYTQELANILKQS